MLWLWIPTNICTCQPQLSKSIIIKNLKKPFLFATRRYPGRLSAECTAIFLRTAASRAPTICGEMTFPIWSADPHIGIPSKGAASISSYQIRELVSYILITRRHWMSWLTSTATLTVERTKAVRRESFMLFKAFGFRNSSTQKWVGIVCWILELELRVLFNQNTVFLKRSTTRSTICMEKRTRPTSEAARSYEVSLTLRKVWFRNWIKNTPSNHLFWMKASSVWVFSIYGRPRSYTNNKIVSEP